MRGKRFGLAVVACGMSLLSGSACAAFDEDYEQKTWQEITVELPKAPRAEALLEFYVSAATDNRFWVDPDSISVGADGVVRYTLVIQSVEGARNVSYEGMRCETREQRIYASGRRSGEWSKSRNNDWTKIREGASNRYHAALFTDFFCPDGVIATSPDSIRRALRREAIPARAW